MIEVRPSGGLRYAFGVDELETVPHTCALDAAAADGMTLEEIGALLNLTREVVREIADEGLRRVHRELRRQDGVDVLEGLDTPG